MFLCRRPDECVENSTHSPDVTAAASTARRAALVAWLEPRRRFILLAMLVLLHLALLDGVGSAMDKLLMVVHIGLFFLWQPFVRKEQQLSPVHLVLLAGVVAVMTLLQGTALMMIWCMLLGGIIGGKVFVIGSRWNRFFHLAALAYLVGALLLFLLPRLLPPTVVLSLSLDSLARFGLPLALLAMLVVPAEPDVSDRREVIDFAYSVFVFLLLAVLVLGSLAGMLLTGIGYVESLLAVLLVISIVLVFLGWSWNPRAGFSGLGAFVSRYLFSAGLPFELWVEALATYPTDDTDPDDFVTGACNKLLGELGWLNGLRWSSQSNRGEVGRMAGHVTRFNHRGLTFDVHTNVPLTPAVVWQFNILLLLLDEFYLARIRERQLREIGFMQAIYETGSRLTHDVKNILQSLNALCAAAAEADQGSTSAEYQRLIRRQLPAIAKRLGQTLDKLGHAAGDEAAVNDAANWWRWLQDSFVDRGIMFAEHGDLARLLLPSNLFSTAAENLIQNALDKKTLQPGLKIEVSLAVESTGLVLEVCDDGHAIGERLAGRLGIAPVRSDNGLGIGLYQTARLAAAAGYRLELAENAAGRVCFRLQPEGSPAQS